MIDMSEAALAEAQVDLQDPLKRGDGRFHEEYPNDYFR
jgi:hypothetical protein